MSEYYKRSNSKKFLIFEIVIFVMEFA